MSKECGGLIRSKSGWITSPDMDTDGQYDFNINCSWVVEAEENDTITFEVRSYDIEDSDACNSDYLKVS